MIINKKRNYKKFIIVLLSIILLFLITIVIIHIYKGAKHKKFLEQETQRVKQYTAITDFQSMQEVALYANCDFIKQEDSERENISYDVYIHFPEKIGDGENSHKNLVENLIQYSAYVLKYKNFVIIDEKNKTTITVYCKEDQKLVETYYINNIENYYEVIEAKENLENFEKIETIELEVNSPELQQLLEKSWKADAVNFGTFESTYRNYDIYFDEGIQVRTVAGKVFNIIFTDKYTKPIVNNLTVNSSTEEIQKSLGKPQFERGNLIGYKGKNMYVFFYKNQVSIYRIEEFQTENIAQIIKDRKSDVDNEKEFVDKIKAEWKDYDIYDYNTDYVRLQYTLKGLCVRFDGGKKRGIIVYNNYSGNIYGNTTLEDLINNKEELPNGITIENKDLVFEEEQERIDTLDDTTSAYNYTTSGVILNTSNQFKIYKKPVNENTSAYKIRFISIGAQYPNTELREMITMGMWYDDYNFVYSVKGRGIFIYNAKERTYKTLVKGTGEYSIKDIRDGVVYYDDSTINIGI